MKARSPRSLPGRAAGLARGLGIVVFPGLAFLALAGCGDDTPRESPDTPPAVETPAPADDGPANDGAVATDGTTAPDALDGAPELAPPGGIGRLDSMLDAAAVRDFPAARFSSPGRIPAYEQRPGDPVRGREALLGEPYVECGLPERVWRELNADEEIPVLPGRGGDGADLPYYDNRTTDANGVDLVVSNCLACHGTNLFGDIVIGLGNEFLDFTGDASLLAERAGAFVRGEAETAAWERYADRIGAIAPYMRTKTVGTNPANNLTFVLIAHRDPETQAWYDEPQVPLPESEVAPVSVPPWWRMAKKHAMFSLGEGRGDHGRIMMAASMLCTDDRPSLEKIDAYAPDISAYLKSLEPPAWPFDVDAATAATGEGLFVENCSRCHGRYGDDAGPDAYPNLLVPLETVGTDPVLVDQAHATGVAYVDRFNRSYYGELSTAAPGPGYVAPPLDGIWATAPYGHNGSVPNLRLWLDSDARPTYWRSLARDATDKALYDPVDVGWRHEDLAAGQDAVADPRERVRVYDTTLRGHANSGHTFGDHLSEAERDAVVEYLKTL